MDFKEYIEKRSVVDIMSDYSEQSDEWERLIVTKEGKLISFRHSNGREFFCEQIEDYTIPETVAKTLKGKTVENQMKHYGVIETTKFSKMYYGEETEARTIENAVSLSEYNDVRRLLLKGDILVGAIVKGYFKDGNLLLDKCVCTYYASDDEGSGSNDREDYANLIFSEGIIG